MKNPVNKDSIKPIKVLEGIYRKTMSYNDTVMLCIFNLDKNSKIPLHSHEAHQIGYVNKGKIKFITEDGEIIAKKGESYIFDSWEKHGAIIIETAEVVEVFCPTREDYKR